MTNTSSAKTKQELLDCRFLEKVIETMQEADDYIKQLAPMAGCADLVNGVRGMIKHVKHEAQLRAAAEKGE